MVSFDLRKRLGMLPLQIEILQRFLHIYSRIQNILLELNVNIWKTSQTYHCQSYSVLIAERFYQTHFQHLPYFSKEPVLRLRSENVTQFHRKINSTNWKWIEIRIHWTEGKMFQIFRALRSAVTNFRFFKRLYCMSQCSRWSSCTVLWTLFLCRATHGMAWYFEIMV